MKRKNQTAGPVTSVSSQISSFEGDSMRVKRSRGDVGFTVESDNVKRVVIFDLDCNLGRM